MSTVAVAVPAGEQEDRQRQALQFRVVVALDLGRGAHAAILRVLRSACGVVAGRPRCAGRSWIRP